MGDTANIVVKIDGMHCGGCVTRLTNVLKKTPGLTVKDVQVGSAELTYAPHTVSPIEISAIIEQAGFVAASIRETES